MRAALVALLLASPAAAAPTGYQCAPGTAKVGVGCSCPSTHASATDSEGIAICRAKPVVAPVTPPQPEKPPSPRAGTTRLFVTLTPAFKAGGTVVPITPELSLASVQPVQSQPTGIRLEQIMMIEQLIADTPDSDAQAKADLYFRLAEAYVVWFRANAKNAAKQNSIKLQVVAAFTKLTSNAAFKSYARLDHALYFFASFLELAGHTKEAQPLYTRLIKEFEYSKYIPDAHAAIGEYAFDQGDFAAAEAAFERVTKYPKAAAFHYARYKLGFVQLRGGRALEASKTFWSLVTGSAAQFQAPGKKAFLFAYAEAGQPSEIWRVTVGASRATALAMSNELAELYVLQGRHDRAQQVYQMLIAQTDGTTLSPGLCGALFGHARATAALAVTAKPADVCATDVERFKQWAKAAGVEAK